MSGLRRVLPFVVMLAGLLLTAGCEGNKVKPNGKVVRGGQPFTLSDKGVFVIAFTAVDEKSPNAPMYNAETKPDGTFTIIGPERKGIPPGKYKAIVQAFDPYPTKDLLAGKYTAGTTQLVVDVGKDEVVLDVGK